MLFKRKFWVKYKLHSINRICGMQSITAGNYGNTLVCKSKEVFTDNALIVRLMVLHQDKCKKCMLFWKYSLNFIRVHMRLVQENHFAPCNALRTRIPGTDCLHWEKSTNRNAVDNTSNRYCINNLDPCINIYVYINLCIMYNPFMHMYNVV